MSEGRRFVVYSSADGSPWVPLEYFDDHEDAMKYLNTYVRNNRTYEFKMVEISRMEVPFLTEEDEAFPVPELTFKGRRALDLT